MSRPNNQYLIYQNFPIVEQKCALPKKNKKSMDGFINHVFDAKIPRMSETDNLYSMPSTVSRLNCMEQESLSPCLPPCLLESERMQYVQHWINEIQDESHWRDLTLESEAVQSSSSGGSANTLNNANNTGDNASLIGSTTNYQLSSYKSAQNATGAIAGGLYDFLDNHSRKKHHNQHLAPANLHNSNNAPPLYDYNNHIHHTNHQTNLVTNGSGALVPGITPLATTTTNINHHHQQAANLLSTNPMINNPNTNQLLPQHSNHQFIAASTRFTIQETDLLSQIFHDYFRQSLCPGLAEIRARLTSNSSNHSISLLAKRRTPQAIRAKIKRLQQQPQHPVYYNNNGTTLPTTVNNNTNNTNTNSFPYNSNQHVQSSQSHFLQQSSNFNLLNLQNDSSNHLKNNHFY